MKIFIGTGRGTASLNIYEGLSQVYLFESTDRQFEGEVVLTAKQGDHELFLTTTDRLIDEDWVTYQRLMNEIVGELDLIVMGAWHSGNSPPLLAVHTGGNPTDSPDRIQLAKSPASLMKDVLRWMKELNVAYGLNRLVCMEAVHGPPVGYLAPYMALEIGSDEEAWGDPRAGLVIATALQGALESPARYPNIVVIGGSHYSSKVSRLLLETEYAVSHFFAEYQVNELAISTLEQALCKAETEVQCIVIEKMKSSRREKIHGMAARLGVEVRDIKEVLA